MQNDLLNDLGIEPDLPEAAPKNPKNVGGFASHKPGCICRPCTARRRKEEAIASGAGPLPPTRRELSRQKQEAIDADQPALVTRGKPLRQRIAQYVELRAMHPELKTAEIARKLGLPPNTLYSYISRAVKLGMLKFDDPISRLDYEIAPKVLDNLNTYLDQKDKAVTIEAAKGILFPAYKEAKGINEDQNRNVIAIKFEFPSSGSDPIGTAPGSTKAISGQVVGRPKSLPVIDIEPV